MLPVFLVSQQISDCRDANCFPKALLMNIMIMLKWMKTSLMMIILRVKFDHKLCFKEYIEHVITEAHKGLSAMSLMAAASIK